MEIGLGQLSLSPDEFWRITPYEFLCKQKGFFDLETTRNKQDWSRTLPLLNIQLRPQDKVTLESIFGEKKPNRIMSREEFENLDKKWSSYGNRGNESAVSGRHGEL